MPKRIILLLMVILMLSAIGCGSQTQVSQDIATVNGVKISQVKLDQQYTILKVNYESQLGITLDATKDLEMIQTIRNTAYDEVITKELVRQEADKQGLKITGAQIDTTLNNFKQAQNSAEADGYKKILDKLQLTEADLRQEIENSQLFQLLEEKVTGEIKVSEAEALIYYQANPDQFRNPGGMQIYHILVGTEQTALEVMDKIRLGEDFAALAKQYSLDPGSKDKGGDVGLVNEDTSFVPEFKQAALTLQSGQLYPQAVKTTYGYHIIKAGTKQAAEQMSFEQVKSQIITKLQQDQRDKAFSAYLEQLKNAADIKDLRQK